MVRILSGFSITSDSDGSHRQRLDWGLLASRPKLKDTPRKRVVDRSLWAM
jgi:hypothetical protein